MESNNTLNNEQSAEECEESLKGPSFTLMYVLIVALLSFVWISLYTVNQLVRLEKESTNQVSEIKNALVNLETLPDHLYTADGEKKNLSVTIEYPKIFVNEEDYLGTIVPIIQEQNAQAYDKLSSNLTLFSVIIALFTLALPIFSYAFIQKDQLRNINAQHYRLKKDAERRIKQLEEKNAALETTLKETVDDAIKLLRKEINQAQEVTSSVIPSPKGNETVEITPTSESPADTARALNLGARINLSKINYDEALKQIDHASILEPNNAEHQYVKSLILWNKGEYADTLVSDNRALELDPNNAKYCISRGVTLHKLKRYEDALKDKNKAIELEPNNAKYYVSRGATLHALKRYEDALKDNNKAIELEPNNAKSFDWRATTYWRLKRNKDAHKDFERALQIEPNVKTYQAAMAYSLYKEKHYDQALDHCTKLGNDIDSLCLALRARAMSTLKHALLTGNLISREERELVLNDLDKAEEIDPKNQFTLIDQAQAYFLLKEYDSMKGSLEKALAIDPDEPETYHWLAEYYRAIGDAENAALNDRLADEKGYIPEPEE